MTPKGPALLGAGGTPVDLETIATVFRPNPKAPAGENIISVVVILWGMVLFHLGDRRGLMSPAKAEAYIATPDNATQP